MSQVKHNCGLCVAHTLHDVYSFTKSLQHRGREAAGIAAIGNNKIDVIKWAGDFNKFDLEDLHDIFPGHKYHTFMGHVRYATRGRKDKILEDAHPHTIGGKSIVRNGHIIIRDCEAVIVHNGQVDEKYIPISNRRSLKTECDSERILHYLVENNEFELMTKSPGAYTLAFTEKNREEIVVMRDVLGMLPGILGKKDGKFGVASEDVAFKLNGGEPVEDLQPGNIYYLNANGNYRKKEVIKSKIRAHCMFQFQYIINKLTIADSVSTKIHRENLGHQLAEENLFNEIAYLTYAPRCPEMAARVCAKDVGLPFIKVFYKPVAERSFQGSTKKDRELSINENFYLIPGIEEIIEGKEIGVVEDSIVRGNVLARIKHLLYDEARVKKAHLISYTPPLCITGEDGINRGCMFGVDMPPEPILSDEYFARGRTSEQISEKAGMPVSYLSLEGMLVAFERSGMSRENLCTYCLGGEHPFTRLTIEGK